MKLRTRKRAYVALSAWMLTVSACVAQNITGAGASFPNPIYSRWFAEYARLHPGVRINYQPVGSGAGIRQVSLRIVDFGATDAPIPDMQLARSKVKLLHIPTVVGAVVPVYNLPGASRSLNFAPDVLADIYLGRITKWNDARLVGDNPGVELPDKAIAVVYRADGSGTTYVFTDYLCKVSDAFRKKVGCDTSVRWPVGVGQKGNEGVAGIVRGLPYAIGYVELAYALQNNVTYGNVRNAAGAWVRACQKSVTAAAGEADAAGGNDYRVSITDPRGNDSYPIASFTWLLIPEHAADAAKGQALAGFLRWMLDRGQQEAASEMYAPLPKLLADRVRVSLDQLH